MEKTGPPADGGFEARIDALEARLEDLEAATIGDRPSSLASRTGTLEEALRALRRQATTRARTVATERPGAAAPTRAVDRQPVQPTPARPETVPPVAATPRPTTVGATRAAAPAAAASSAPQCQARDGRGQRCVLRAGHSDPHNASRLMRSWVPVAAAARPTEPAPVAAERTAAATAPPARRATEGTGALGTPRWGPDRIERPSPSLLARAEAGLSDRLDGVDLREAAGRFIEENTGRVLAAVAGVALLGAVVFGVGYGIQAGIITEQMRVYAALLAGILGLVVGAAFLERGNRLLGHVLTPVGLAAITISLVAGTRLYDTFPVPFGLAVALGAAMLTAVIAVRANSQLVAGFGLVSVLAAPPLLGASPDLTTLAFVGTALVGTTAIALWRSWSWLPSIAFLLAAPQAAVWLLEETNVMFGLAGLGAFWLLNAVAAAGEEFRRRSRDLSPTSATLLLADAAFVVWGGFQLLDGTYEAYRFAFLLAVAVAHLALGVWFLLRDGDMSLFGLLVSGTGVAALTLAAPIGLGAPYVPVAWAAEAVALAWLASRRGHAYSALVSAILYGLAAAYVVAFLFPYRALVDGVAFPAAPLALAVYVAALAAGAVVVRDRTVWSILSTVGLLLTGWAVIVAAETEWIVVGLTGLLVLGTAIRRALPLVPEQRPSWRSDGRIRIPAATETVAREIGRGLLPLTLLIGGTIATGVIVLVLGGGTPADRPFLDPAGAALATYLVGLVAIGTLERSWATREGLAALGLLVVAWGCPFELSGVALVGGWSLLAIAGAAVLRGLRVAEARSGSGAAGLDRHELKRLLEATPTAGAWAGSWDWSRLDRLLALPAAVAVPAALAVGHVILVELPILEFGRVLPPEIPFSDVGALAAAILAATSIVLGLIVGGPMARRFGIVGAGLVVAYLIPYEVYAWAVAVLWAGLSIAAVVASRLDRADPWVFRSASAVILAPAAAVAVAIVAPPLRLVVSDAGLSVAAAIEAFLALGSVTIAAGVLTWNERAELWGPWLKGAVALGVVYTASVATVDVFTTQVGGAVATQDLRAAGQTALSIVWTSLGVIAFVVGLWRQRSDLRLGGLALLAVAIAKVFLVDLASLDVIYRVISLAVLGLLLLASAWLWQHLRPGGHAPGPHAPGRPAH